MVAVANSITNSVSLAEVERTLRFVENRRNDAVQRDAWAEILLGRIDDPAIPRAFPAKKVESVRALLTLHRALLKLERDSLELYSLEKVCNLFYLFSNLQGSERNRALAAMQRTLKDLPFLGLIDAKASLETRIEQAGKQKGLLSPFLQATLGRQRVAGLGAYYELELKLAALERGDHSSQTVQEIINLGLGCSAIQSLAIMNHALHRYEAVLTDFSRLSQREIMQDEEFPEHPLNRRIRNVGRAFALSFRKLFVPLALSFASLLGGGERRVPAMAAMLSTPSVTIVSTPADPNVAVNAMTAITPNLAGLGESYAPLPEMPSLALPEPSQPSVPLAPGVKKHFRDLARSLTKALANHQKGTARRLAAATEKYLSQHPEASISVAALAGEAAILEALKRNDRGAARRRWELAKGIANHIAPDSPVVKRIGAFYAHLHS